MKGSPVFPGLDTDSYDFDPQTDFAQFLEEARKYTNDKEVLPAQGGESWKKQEQVTVEKKSKKKPWKLTALFSFLKPTKKKSKNCPEPTNTKPPRGYVSGPVFRPQGADVGPLGNNRVRRPASGPLTGMFHKTKKEEDQNGEVPIPYVSLDKLNRPQYDAKAYGPVYLVS